MADFLSADWLRGLDDAVRSSAQVSSPVPIVVEQIVHDVPGRGVVRYCMVIDDEGARVVGQGDTGTGCAGRGLRLTTDYASAVAIATGRENAQRALAEGRLRLGGDVGVLVRGAPALDALHDVTAGLRADTTYPPP